MSSLIEHTFQHALLDASVVNPQGLRDGHGREAGCRFDVYRNNVAVSLTEALEVGFPVIAKLLGQGNFHHIAGVYLRSHPPTSPLMIHYGQEFPRFLQGFEPLVHLGYLADVARLELGLRQSYHAADVPPADPAILANLPPDNLQNARFELAPALVLVTSPWPIFDIWAANSLPDQPKPRAIAQDVLITRAEFDPDPHALLDGGHVFIEMLQTGQTLGDAAEKATTKASKAKADFDLGAMLGLLLNHNAICSVTT